MYIKKAITGLTKAEHLCYFEIVLSSMLAEKINAKGGYAHIF